MPDHELRSFERADANQEGAGAGAARQARRFSVEVDQPLRRGQGGLGKKQIQGAQVGDGNIADAQLAVRPAEGECLPGDKVFAEIVFLEHPFHVFFDAFGGSLRGKRARLRRLLHAAQKIQRLLELAVRVARRRSLLELAKFLIEVHRLIAIR